MKLLEQIPQQKKKIERSRQRRKSKPPDRGVEVSLLLCSRSIQLQGRSQKKKIKEMKDMHDEKMNVMSKFLDIFAKSIQKD